MKLKDMNARLDRAEQDIAGVVMTPRYTLAWLGDRHKTSKLHVALVHDVVRSDDPHFKPGDVIAYTLCDASREASVTEKGDLIAVDCDKCIAAVWRLMAKGKSA